MAANEAERSGEVGKQSLAANVSAAEAAVELAKINLDNTRIVAPRDGRLGQVAVRVGAYVGPGTQLMGLVPQPQGRVSARSMPATPAMPTSPPARQRRRTRWA